MQKKRIDTLKLPRKRVREYYDEGKLKELAASLLTYGQITPIMVDEHNFIISGARTYLAAKIAGFSEVLVEVIHLPDLERMELELAVGTQTIPHQWYELTMARADIFHDLKRKHPDLSLRAIARRLGVVVSCLSDDLKIAEYAEQHPEVFAERSKNRAKEIVFGLEETEQDIREKIVRTLCRLQKNYSADLIMECFCEVFGCELK